MRRTATLAGALAGTMLLAATPAGAQTRTPSAFQITPYAGYLVAGNLFEAPLGTSLSSAGGALYGGQLAMKLSQGVSLVGNVGYSSGDLRVGVPLLGGLSVGRSRMLVYDAGLQLDLPAVRSTTLSLAPFVQAGAGAIRHDIDVGTGTTPLLKTRATNLAGNVGIGADLPLGRTAAIRLMAKDYIGRFDFKEAAVLDLDTPVAHNWALTAGVRIDF